MNRYKLLIGLLFCKLSIYADEPVAYFSTSNISPWGYELNNRYEGLLYDVSRALQKESGIKIINSLSPYPRVIHALKNGDVDFAIMFNSPQAKEIGIFIGRVVDTKILLMGLSNTNPTENLNELDQKYIGYLRGSKYGSVFDNNSKIHKVPLDSMEQGLRMLLKKRLYAVAGAEQTFYYNLKKLNIPITEVSKLMVINETSGNLYFSKKSKNNHLIEPFKKALKSLKDKGTLKAIFYENDFMPSQ